MSGFEPPDIPSPLATVLGLFQEGVAMSIAPSMPASVPVDPLPVSAHRLRWNVADTLRRLAARASVQQVSDAPANPPNRQRGVLPHPSRRLSARSAVPLQQCVATPITRHHPAVP
ncbi:hypothetical protein [Xanthomonas melonis]|nr:hypothetical protein [Xanthomonas melonis]